ncbi:energy transducer TonB [Ferrimonas gelatinilytica]|uniref:Protein TonB n=1 Tax=Ferrimonas gelatinilytica TaxID=1255257 RepID=A0ABP9S0Q4_9GAMM
MMGRALIATALGLSITLLLFVFMASLVEGGDRQAQGRAELPPIQVTMDRQDSDAQRRTRVLPPAPQLQSEPPALPPMELAVESAASTESLALELPTATVAGGIVTDLTAPGTPIGGLAGNGEAMPIQRVEPRYPADASRRRIEGYVVMSFTIDEAGGVTDIRVLEGQPRRVFDREAMNALSRWKYRPKVEDGKPVRQPDQQIRLDFELTQ